MRQGSGVAGLDLLLRRRSTVGYSAGMAAYTFVIVALYPAFEHTTSLDKLTQDNKTIAALFGILSSITSPGGWLNANVYQNLFPLVLLLCTVGYGASSLAGQDEDGTLGPLVALPVRRTTIVTGKVAALAVQALCITAATAAFTIVGRAFHVAIPAGAVVGTSAAVLLLGADFGLLAMAVGAATGRRGLAIGVASALAVASYLVSSLAPVVSWIRPARVASLFWWSVADNQISTGVSAADLAVLVGAAVALGLAAALLFDRLDVH